MCYHLTCSFLELLCSRFGSPREIFCEVLNRAGFLVAQQIHISEETEHTDSDYRTVIFYLPLPLFIHQLIHTVWALLPFISSPSPVPFIALYTLP